MKSVNDSWKWTRLKILGRTIILIWQNGSVMHECDFRNGLNQYNMFWHCSMVRVESIQKFKVQQSSFFVANACCKKIDWYTMVSTLCRLTINHIGVKSLRSYFPYFGYKPDVTLSHHVIQTGECRSLFICHTIRRKATKIDRYLQRYWVLFESDVTFMWDWRLPKHIFKMPVTLKSAAQPSFLEYQT